MIIDAQTATAGIVSLISIIAILALYWWPMRMLRVDEHRQNVFRVRNELFLYAARGNVSFDHPAYQMLRTTLNGAIQDSYSVSATKVLLHQLFMYNLRKVVVINWGLIWEDALRDLPRDIQTELNCFRYRLRVYNLQFLLFGSLTKKAAFLPFYLFWRHAMKDPTIFPELPQGKASENQGFDDVEPEVHVHSMRWVRPKTLKIPSDSMEAGAYIVGSTNEHSFREMSAVA